MSNEDGRELLGNIDRHFRWAFVIIMAGWAGFLIWFLFPAVFANGISL